MADIFSFIEDQVESSMGGWMKQTQVITDAVSNPLGGIVNQVSGGIWKGQGADRFVEEMKSKILPMLASLFTVNMNFVGAVKKSQEGILTGQQSASQIASSLADDFNSI